MTAEIKRRYRLFSRANGAWEIQKLERLSAEGWQLSRRTWGRMDFVRDDGVRYRYAIDFRYCHDEALYLDMFRADGWDCVAMLGDDVGADNVSRLLFLAGDSSQHENGCWYFFRKPWDSVLPAEEYEIYTDEESMQAARRKMAQPLRNCAILMLLLALVYALPLLVLEESLTGQGVRRYAVMLAEMFAAAGLYIGLWLKTRQGGEMSAFVLWLARGLYILSVATMLCHLWKTSGMLLGWPLLFLLLAVAARSLGVFYRGGKRVKAIEGAAIVLFILLSFGRGMRLASLEQNACTVTASNSPMPLFMQLDPGLTEAEVWAQRDDGDWYIERNAQEHRITVRPADGSVLFMEDGGAFLTMVFDPVSGNLSTATMMLKSADGTATCTYTPYGELRLTVKTALLLPQKELTPANVEEAAALIMETVFPEGYAEE